MRRTLTLLALTACVASGLHAELEWIDRDYNFGTWSEEEGPRSGRTLIVNHNDTPLLIRRVRPSCGCTGVEWPRDPVAPGDTAVISFSYNPEGRPGPFEKTIKVFVGESGSPEIINIAGTVIGNDNSLLTRYPYAIGPLRVSQLSYDFGNVTYGDSRHTFISLYNTSPDPVTPALAPVMEGADMLPVEATLTPATVEPGHVQTLSLYLNTRGSQLGQLSTVRTICVGADCLDITIKGNIVPAATTLTPEQLREAPQCDVRPDVADIGSVKRGKTKTVNFTITNTGKSLLTVSRVYASRPSVKIKGWPMRLKPGKSGKVTVEVSTADYPSDIISDVIEIITDDPLKPVRSVRMVGQIKSSK